MRPPGGKKLCVGCNRLRLPDRFNFDDSKPDGKQSLCVRCKRRCRDLVIDGWRAFRAVLAKEPGIRDGWSIEIYHSILKRTDYRCSYCHAQLRRYQDGGHCLDRITSENRAPHAIGNVVACCSVCNRKKQQMLPEHWRKEVERYRTMDGGIYAARSLHDGLIAWEQMPAGMLGFSVKRCDIDDEDEDGDERFEQLGLAL